VGKNLGRRNAVVSDGGKALQRITRRSERPSGQVREAKKNSNGITISKGKRTFDAKGRYWSRRGASGTEKGFGRGGDSRCNHYQVSTGFQIPHRPRTASTKIEKKEKKM